jgi:hypothetical protein
LAGHLPGLPTKMQFSSRLKKLNSLSGQSPCDVNFVCAGSTVPALRKLELQH